jgi:hypothetical protein
MRLNTDPGPIRIQDFDDQKLGKIYSWEKFFLSKNNNYLSLGLHKERPSYRRILQPSEENIQHFKTRNFLIFVTVSHFYPPGSRSGSTDLIESGSETLPI